MREVPTSHCTVLVADDSIDTLEVLGLGLRTHGYRVELARNGAEALEFLRDNCCHVVVSDLGMPTMGGVELLNTIRSRAELEGLPVILMSAAHGDLVALESKSDGILKKPFDFKALLRMLSRIHCLPHVGRRAPATITAGQFSSRSAVQDFR